MTPKKQWHVTNHSWAKWVQWPHGWHLSQLRLEFASRLLPNIATLNLSWPGGSQRESRRFARIDSQQSPYCVKVQNRALVIVV